jgi:hypothetical protein
MKRCFSVFLFAALVLVATSASAFDGFGPTHKHFHLQTTVFNTVHQYWLVQDLLSKLSQNDPDALEEYEEACNLFNKQSQDLGKRLLAAVDEPKREILGVISEMYCSFDPNARQALFPALAHLKTALHQEFKFPLSEAEFREYFPGYGYTEPGYKYRKGREIDRENKGVTWQSEERSITSTFKVSITISLDILSILKGMVTGGAIKNLKVHREYEVNMGGTPMFVADVSFEVVKSLVTKTNRKFEVNKIWFELLRAKVSGYSTGPYEVCGKTYEIINEPTGEEVVTNINEK